MEWDRQDLLSDRQVVAQTTYSAFMKDLGYTCNWGQTTDNPKWLQVIIEGTHANKLTVMLMGATKSDLSDGKVISQSRQYEVAELKKGVVFSLAVPPTDFTYQYVYAKYVVDGTSDDTGTPSEDKGSLCPPLEVGTHPAELANGVTAFFTSVNTTNEIYHVANEDKQYYN